tara:strand:- start:7891 stop:8061 length:171 start_codon:yes stop_codon:yes gene_type:complete
MPSKIDRNRAKAFLSEIAHYAPPRPPGLTAPMGEQDRHRVLVPVGFSGKTNSCLTV